MDEEMRMLQLDKPGQGKSNIEIQKHSIDESVFERKPLERALYILSKGDELQKLSVIGSLPELLKFDKNGTVAKILPKIQQELPNSSSEFSLAVSRMFNILMRNDVPVNLIPQVLQGIENKDPVIANAWMETLLSVIPVLKETVIKNDVLKCAISKSQLSRTAYFRVSSCKILGKISVHRTMNPFEVKKDVLPLVQSLCQDCFSEVRAAMCRELPSVAQGLYNLGDTVVKVNLLPILVELSSDENVSVRAIAIESVVAIIPFLSPETLKGTIIPLTKKLCTRSVSEGDITYTAIASVFSKLITNLQNYLTPGDAMWYLDYYNHISKKGLSLVEDLDSDPSVSMMCRENCANTLPKLAQMVLALISFEICSKWYQAFKALAADPCYIVRKAVASCFAEVAHILGANNKLIVIDFTKLLRDEDEEVLQALVPNCALVMELFATSGVLTKDLPVQATLDIGRAMLKCQNEVFKTNNWRLKESLLKQWERLPNCMPSDFIHQHYTPVVLNATLYGKAKPVRSQASRTLLIILRYSLKENHRKWIREMIQNQLCNSSCCYSRQIFVKLCAHALEIFSWKYFKEHFYMPLLSIAEDSVSIVRLCMVKLCPVLKQMLILPMDRGLQLKLENILSKMEMIESDKDVIRTLKTKLREMRSFQINKNEVLMEERRKIDEEEKILKGKIPQLKLLTLTKDNTSDATKEIDKTTSQITVTKPTRQGSKRLADGTSSTMSFLDQHFYIDAGVSLPHFEHSLPQETNVSKKPMKDIDMLTKSTENITFKSEEATLQPHSNLIKENNTIPLNESDMVISAENINIESLTEKDLEALGTKTTNITDDVKVNLQKISKGGLRKRPKRYSCVFSSEIGNKSSATTHMKRRSLNIVPTNDSRIPVCSYASKRLSVCQKSKSVSDQNLDVSSHNSPKASGLPRFTKSTLNLKSNIKKYDENLNDTVVSHKHKLLTKSDDELAKKSSSNANAQCTVTSNTDNKQISDNDAKLDIEEIRHENIDTPVAGHSVCSKDNQDEIVKIKEIRRKSSGLPVSIGRRTAK